MVEATLSIALPAGNPLRQVTSAHPETTLSVLATVPDETSSFALVRIDGPGAVAAVEELGDHPGITDPTIVRDGETEATVHFETAAPLPLPPHPPTDGAVDPVEIREGRALVELVGSRERLAELVERLEAAGLQYRFTDVNERFHERQTLSDRQREVIVTAVDRGYYDTPRRCTLTELADHVGIAKSTCSQTLHRAEGAVVSRFVQDLAESDAIDRGRSATS